jgi:hypothetical protein
MQGPNPLGPTLKLFQSYKIEKAIAKFTTIFEYCCLVSKERRRSCTMLVVAWQVIISMIVLGPIQSAAASERTAENKLVSDLIFFF